MHVSLNFLKDVGKFEKELTELECKRTIERLTPYSDYPEVAKVIDYIRNYRTPIPETHMVFSFIESLDNKKKNKLEVQNRVQERMVKKGIKVPDTELQIEAKKKKKEKTKEEIDEEIRQVKEESKKCLELAQKFDFLLANLEKDCDIAYDFFNKNANSMGLVVKSYRLNGVRNMLMSLKGNLRALKLR